MTAIDMIIKLEDFPGGIDAQKKEAQKRLLGAAANARRRLGAVDGMDGVYAKKAAEAAAILAAKKFDPEKDETSFPFIRAEVEARGSEKDLKGAMLELAQTIQDRANASDAKLAQVEAIRIGAKQKIDMAQHIGDVLRVMGGLNWPQA